MADTTQLSSPTDGLAGRIVICTLIGLVIGLAMGTLHVGFASGVNFWVDVMFVTTGFAFAATMFMMIASTSTKLGWGE